MKFKINAGAEIDVLTHKEMCEALDKFRASWQSEIARGDRYRDYRGAGQIAGTAVSIGGDRDQDGAMGPSQGYVWSVKRLAVVSAVAADVALLTLFKNDNSPSSTVKPVLATYNTFDANELVLYPGDKLLVENSAALAGTGIITVSGQVRELPIGLAWRLN